jgi:hypothetical protein
VSLIAADDPPGGAIRRLVTELTKAGLSANPCDRPSFGAILTRLEADSFQIVEGVDSEAVWAFVRAVEAAEP